MSLQNRKSSRCDMKLGTNWFQYNPTDRRIYRSIFFMSSCNVVTLHDSVTTFHHHWIVDCPRCWCCCVIIVKMWNVIRIKTYLRNFFSCCTKINKRNVYKVSAKANGYSLFLKCILWTKRYDLTKFRILQQLIVRKKKKKKRIEELIFYVFSI